MVRLQLGIARGAVEGVAPQALLWWRQRRRRANWERRWSQSAYAPQYELGEADPAVRGAVADGWFAAGMDALDIGSGRGHNAAFLARCGLRTIGIDFSPSAIARARAAFVDVPDLTFEVVDVVAGGGLDGAFDALVDRGCLHGLDSAMYPGYLRSVSTWARPGSHFLVIMRTKSAAPEDVVAAACSLLEPVFAFEEWEPNDLAGPTASQRLPAVSMRFTRTY